MSAVGIGDSIDRELNLRLFSRILRNLADEKLSLRKALKVSYVVGIEFHRSVSDSRRDNV